jgi:hypothetical protein
VSTGKDPQFQIWGPCPGPSRPAQPPPPRLPLTAVLLLRVLGVSPGSSWAQHAMRSRGARVLRAEGPAMRLYAARQADREAGS